MFIPKIKFGYERRQNIFANIGEIRKLKQKMVFDKKYMKIQNKCC